MALSRTHPGTLALVPPARPFQRLLLPSYRGLGERLCTRAQGQPFVGFAPVGCRVHGPRWSQGQEDKDGPWAGGWPSFTSMLPCDISRSLIFLNLNPDFQVMMKVSLSK